MPSRYRLMAYLAIVCLAIMASLYLIMDYYASPERQAERAYRKRAGEEQALFEARFDSLYHSVLLPTVSRYGVFTKTAFDGDYREWTLYVSSNDWYRRDMSSKRDLVATLWTCFRSVREQAGGDPDEASLILRDSDGSKVAERSPERMGILK